MAPLRFRAWHKPSGKMFAVETMQFTRGGIVQDFPVSAETDYDFRMWADDTIFMQSTGCLDSTEQEMFKDDIVEIKGQRAVIDQEPADSQFFFRQLNEDKWCDDWNFADDSYRCTIIGNLYETPDLLSHD